VRKPRTKAEYQALGRLGGLATAATHDMRRVAAHARRFAPSSLDYWRAKVDAKGELAKSDRDSRARAAMRLHYSKMSRKQKKNGEGTTKAAGTPPAADALTEAHQLGPDGRPSG
jgi:hypothetical protein